MHIFISHINEESAVALCLKEWLDSTLLGQCDVFVSSDQSALPAGVRWLDHMDQALQRANLMIVLCSASSVSRPWVNFETGCGWARGIPIIPVCYSGMSKAQLPRPLGEFQGLNAGDDAFPEAFFAAVTKHLGLKRTPRVDVAMMRAEVAKAVGAAKPLLPTASTDSALPRQPDGKPSLRSESVAILRLLAVKENFHAVDEIAQDLGVSMQKTKFFLDELKDGRFVKTVIDLAQGTMYALDKEGRKYLFERGLL